MKLTVFTPTYNRASTLQRLFEALQRQTDKRFEWLVVDDGSTDNTKELVEQFKQKTSDFTIRYYLQEHGGKPRAQNKAIDLALGEFFITCDSNKYLAENAVELILKMAETIQNIPLMCGVGGYRADFSGKVYGGSMKIGDIGYLDCTRLENEKYHIFGDKATAFRTDVLRNYKSPEYPGELFVSESVWLIPMATDGYKTRWFPEILVYGEYANDGLTKMGANSRTGHSQNFRGFLHLLRVEINARGTQTVLGLIHEAMEIAKEKGIPDNVLAESIGCSVVQIWRIRIVRSFHRVYGALSRRIKGILGEKATARIRRWKKR